MSSSFGMTDQIAASSPSTAPSQALQSGTPGNGVDWSSPVTAPTVRHDGWESSKVEHRGAGVGDVGGVETRARPRRTSAIEDSPVARSTGGHAVGAVRSERRVQRGVAAEGPGAAGDGGYVGGLVDA